MAKIIILSFLSLLCANVLAQKVAVIEKNRFSSPSGEFELERNRYQLFIRELFRKDGEKWVAVHNSPDYKTDEDSSKPANLKVQYILENEGKIISVKGVSRKQDRQFILSSELFKIQNTQNIKLTKLPQSIIHGFEHDDIIACKIVTDKIVKRKYLSSFKEELLSDSIKNRLSELLIKKNNGCDFRFDTINFALTIKSNIHNKVRLIADGVRLGKVNIVPNNTCFAEKGKAYGGGILHFLVYPNQKIKLLVTNTELIDVADYDNDGKFEYIFFKSWFNNYGYIMYYDNFQKQVVNDWSYH